MMADPLPRTVGSEMQHAVAKSLDNIAREFNRALEIAAAVGLAVDVETTRLRALCDPADRLILTVHADPVAR